MFEFSTHICPRIGFLSENFTQGTLFRAMLDKILLYAPSYKLNSVSAPSIK